MHVLLMRINILLIVLFVVSGFVKITASPIVGEYISLGNLPAKNSLDVVEFEEFLNFSCPHCNNFRKAAQPLKDKYGKRIRVTYIPILFPKQNDAHIRLFYIGEAAGKREEIKNLLFEARFTYGQDLNDIRVIRYLARSSGLGERFDKEGGADWVTEKVQKAHFRASQSGVRATPTIVLQRTIRLDVKSGMKAYVGNMDLIIGQLLKKRS